jgi:galactokinase
MVVVSTLAFLAVNNKLAECVTKRTLVDMTMENERRVEVNSGGCANPQ